MMSGLASWLLSPVWEVVPAMPASGLMRARGRRRSLTMLGGAGHLVAHDHGQDLGGRVMGIAEHDAGPPHAGGEQGGDHRQDLVEGDRARPGGHRTHESDHYEGVEQNEGAKVARRGTAHAENRSDVWALR